jgi:hypothetical protein
MINWVVESNLLVTSYEGLSGLAAVDRGSVWGGVPHLCYRAGASEVEVGAFNKIESTAGRAFGVCFLKLHPWVAVSVADKQGFGSVAAPGVSPPLQEEPLRRLHLTTSKALQNKVI